MRTRPVLILTTVLLFGSALANAEDLVLELIDASRTGDVETLRWALDEGVHPNARGAEGTSALVEAAGQRRYPAVALLLAAGADPDTRNIRNEPVIVLAARHGDLDVIQALIAAGANVDARDTDGVEQVSSETGVTALWVAARWGMIDAARELLAAGANPRTSDYDGVPAWAAARMYGHDEIREMLEAAGAVEPEPEDEGPL